MWGLYFYLTEIYDIFPFGLATLAYDHCRVFINEGMTTPKNFM